MEIKLTDIQYHVRYNADVAHKDVKMSCNLNQFPALSFCGPHSKPHRSMGFSKRYHLHFYPKLDNGVCAILRIPYACVACTSMLYKPWMSGILSNKKEHYKPVINCNFFPVIGSFNNWNIILLSQKSTPYEEFDEIHQFFLEGISDNMASLV